MTVNESVVSRIVELVSQELGKQEAAIPAGGNRGGLFDDVDQAVEAAWQAQKIWQRTSLEERKKVTDKIIEHLGKYIEELSRSELEETGYGVYEDKITKHKNALYQTPSVEDIVPRMQTDDNGVALFEYAPYGVIGALTPSTNPPETVINNSIIMLAAGNTVVFSTHPGAHRTSNRAVELVNEAIEMAGGPKNIIVSIKNPSMEKTNQLLNHPKVTMLCATGGPGVVKAILSTGKKGIGAGAGNPPALVDATADIPKAAGDIIRGCSYDYNIPCIAEKSVVAEDSICDRLIEEMQKNKAYLLKDKKIIDEMTSVLMPAEDSPNKKFIGKSPAHIMKQFGVELSDDIKAVIFEAPRDHMLVMNEQMMPVLPVVRVPDADAAIEVACDIEHGRRHTAICHSNNIKTITEYARRVQCTIFVNNGPCFAGVGVEGVGNAALTIAGPTGEGVTTPVTFTRKRKCVLAGDLNIR